MESHGIDSYNIEALQEFMKELGQPHYRTKQLFSWLYKHGASSYEEMTNLPQALRKTLSAKAPLSFPVVANTLISTDGTRKYVLELADGLLVESVGIPALSSMDKDGTSALSVCISTQVGCPVGCLFCATGKEGFVRNLTPGEIAQQVLVVEKDFGSRVSSVVLMGQGEPFLNYRAVIDGLHILNHPDALGIGARHITVSTCGIADKVIEFGQEQEQFTLAISLHSAIQQTRDRLMPHCASNPLPLLKSSLEAYQVASGRRITLEYMLLAGENDSTEERRALISFCRGLKVHVNLLPYNASGKEFFFAANKNALPQWKSALCDVGIEATIRNSRGADIHGACGQLKNYCS